MPSTSQGEFSHSNVAVVVINYNAGPLLDQCLASIARQAVSPARVFVLDNDSTDGSFDGVQERYPSFCAIRNSSNVGFALAANQGLQLAHAAGADLVAFLNPDAAADESWLQELLAAAARYPATTSFACWMKRADDVNVVDGLGDSYHVSGVAWRRYHGRRLDLDWLVPGEVFGACGGAALYRLKPVMDVGGFDRAFFCYLEDVDLAFRLRLAGHTARLVPSASVGHVGSASSGYRSDFSVYHGTRNLLWVYVRNMPGILLWLTLPLHVLAHVAILIIAASRSQLLVVLKAQCHALRALPERLNERRSIQQQRAISSWMLWKSLSKTFNTKISV